MKSLVLAILGAAIGLQVLPIASPAMAAEITAVSDIRVVDGDTIEVAPYERIRLLELDAPETWKPRCENELDVGMQASDRLRDLLSHGTITIERAGWDRYSRRLASVFVDNVNVSNTLINENLAVRWEPGRPAWLARAQHWCPGYKELAR